MAWTQSGNIKGASGVPGASGASGSPGASGIPGASGASGASGAAGTTTWSGITDKPAVIAAGVDAAAARNVISAEYTGNKGVANGYAALDSSGLVPSSQLPSFVDDVVEAANLAAFPATGDAGKIYTALDTNKVYRWGGSSYTEISPSPGSTDAVPEGSTNLYYTAARADGRITAAVGSTVQAYSATLTTYAGKTAPTGAVVGTTDSQTLTNKDLSGASNTFPAFIKRSVSTITSDTTIGTATNTDYVVLCGGSSSDSNWSSVVSLLNFNGSNNSTTITDSAGTPLTWTASGNAKLTTSNPKFGTASLSCDGTNSFISTGSVSAFDPSVDFTAEFWMRPANTNAGNNGIISAGVNASWNPFALLQDGQKVKWLVGNAAGTGWDIVFGASGDVLTANTWHHVAIVNSSTAFTVYVNGTSALSTTRKSWSSQNREMFIGKNYDGHFNGQIDGFRYTKSVARYTSNFTAPTLEFTQNVAAVPTLPSASSAGTNTYTIKNTTSASVTIGVTSSQQIDGATGGLVLPAGQAARLIADGASGWQTI